MTKAANIAKAAEQNMPLAVSQTDQIGQMVTLAIEKGVGVDGLERLAALYERAQATQARSDFAQAKGRFQKECPIIEKKSSLPLNFNKELIFFLFIEKYVLIERTFSFNSSIISKA